MAWLLLASEECLEVFWDLFAWMWAQPRVPYFYLNGGSECPLACSTSLNYPDPAGQEDNTEGGAPMVPAQLCTVRSEFIILNSCLFLP